MSNPQQPLSDVLYWLSLEDAKPTAAIIDEYRSRFPEYTQEITDFALDLAFDALILDAQSPDAETLAGPPSNLVMKSISDFQNARYQAANEQQANSVASVPIAKTAVAIANPFTSLDSMRFRELTRNLDANTIFVAKLRDRQIMPTTIPRGLTQFVARELNVPTDVVIAHLSAKPAQALSGTYYKAVDKPSPQAQETFEEALRTSGLSPEQQQRLLSL
jgi:hypothetical protein